MDTTISYRQAKTKEYPARVIAILVIIMIYLMVDIAIYRRAQSSITNLPIQEQGSPWISEVVVPLPVPTPPSTQGRVVSTPVPPEPVQVTQILVPQPVPTPPQSQIP